MVLSSDIRIQGQLYNNTTVCIKYELPYMQKRLQLWIC